MTFISVNPHDPSDVIGKWEQAGEREVAAVVERASRAAEEWRRTPAAARSQALGDAAAALERRGDDVIALTVREVGKPVTEARGEVARGVSILRYYAQLALLPDGETLPAASHDALLMARYRPVGVAALLTPWNFPVAIPLWKAAPSLAYGNATVLKPSSAAAATALLVHEIIAPVLPRDVFQVLLGGAETARPLIEQPRVAAVSFTGSVPVGRDIVRRVAERGGKVQAEMGGQNPSIVLADADLDRAAATIAYAAMGYAGQKCTATSRVIVEDAVYADFTERLAEDITQLQVVDPAAEVHEIIAPVLPRDVFQVLLGGAETARPLIEQPRVAAVLRADSPARAVAIANEVRFGLVAAVFTTDLGRALRLTEELDAGMIRVNAPTSGVDFYAPFGGAKESSYGPREQGLAARSFYTESRTVLITP